MSRRWSRAADVAATAVYFAMVVVYIVGGALVLAWMLWTTVLH